MICSYGNIQHESLPNRNTKHTKKPSLSYDVTVNQLITSCHKNLMITRLIILWRVHVTSLTIYMSTMRFLSEIMFILKAMKSHFQGSYVKQNLTLMVI